MRETVTDTGCLESPLVARCLPLRWVFATLRSMSPVKRGKDQPTHDRIQVLRAQRGLTGTQLADAGEVNPRTTGTLEREDHYPGLDPALRICEVVALPVEAVFSRPPFALLSSQVHGRQDA
jgi:putative transcriptional regulator